MPIIGLTTNLAPAFPELGTLRKGGEAPRDKDGRVIRMGPDLTYFRFFSERPEVMKAFTAAYGEKPTQLTVYLPYATVDEEFSAWKEIWGASGLMHRCDGVTMVRWRDADGNLNDTPKACTGGCKQVGRLKVMLPELLTAGYIGFVTVLTSSLHDIMSLQSGLMAAAAASPTGLRGVPFVLWRQARKISTPVGNGKRARREKSLLQIAPSGLWVQAMLNGAEHRAFAMLEAPKSGRSGLNTETGELPILPSDVDDVEDGEFVPGDTGALVEDEDGPAPADEAPDPDLPEPDGADEGVPFEEDTKRQRRTEIKAIYDRNKWDWDIFLGKFKDTYKVDFEQANLTQLDNALESIRRPRQQAAAS